MTEVPCSRVESHIKKAKLAECAERYEDMADAIKLLIQEQETLSTEERNLFSVAYKNLIGSKRHSWRVLKGVETKPHSENELKLDIVKEYRTKVAKEILGLCEEVLELLDRILIPNSNLPEPEKSTEARIFYLKMKADFYRYMAEVEEDNTKVKELKSQSEKTYANVMEMVQTDLVPTNPVRLGLVLSSSVFLYEILHEHQRALTMAQAAFDEAIEHIDSLNDEQYKDSTLILRLLKDNLTQWTGDTEKERTSELKIQRNE